MRHEIHEEAIRFWRKFALFVCLYENDTKAATSVLYHLPGGRLGSSGRLKSVPCRLALPSPEPDTDNACDTMRLNDFCAPEQMLGAGTNLEWKLDVP
jgi:hypothetical protein